MSKNLGKFALVAAIAGSCGYASAATVTSSTGGLPLSLEGNRANTSAVAAVDIGVAFEYLVRGNVSDEIRLTLNQGSFASTGAADVTISCSTTTYTFNANNLDVPGPTLIFTAAPTTTASSAAQTCSFASVTVLAPTLTSAGNVTVTAGIYDSAGNPRDVSSATIASVASQVASVSVQSALNGVIDFQNSLGYGFATDDGSAGVTGNSDNLVIQVVGRDTRNSLGAGTLSMNFALTAESGKSFAFLDGPGCASGAPVISPARTGALAQVASASTGSFTINAACTVVTFVDTFTMSAATTATASLEVGHVSATPSTGVNIEPMTFPSMSTTITQGAITRSTASLSPGSWTSNGSTVQIPYMPVNSTAGASKIDPVIIVSNRSTATGAISAVLRDESGNTCSVDESVLGSIAGNRTKSIGGLIRDAAAGSGCPTLNVAGGEKLSITLTVTLPSGTTEVYSGYTVGGASRVTVVNSSNGQ